MRLTIVPYKPLPEIHGFFLAIESSGKAQFLVNQERQYLIPLTLCRYAPKTGLALAQCLPRCSGDVLDIGTGDSAILAVHARMLGARKVVGCDIDKEAVRRARSVVKDLGISIFKSNFFAEIGKSQFDLIISNPPQMPCPDVGQIHDHGGLDGREAILKILENGRRHLKSSGAIMMLLFDFLGVDKALGKNNSIFEIAEKMGYKTQLLHKFKRTARTGGETAKAKDYICSIYPKFRFEILSTGELEHSVYIARFTM